MHCGERISRGLEMSGGGVFLPGDNLGTLGLGFLVVARFGGDGFLATRRLGGDGFLVTGRRFGGGGGGGLRALLLPRFSGGGGDGLRALILLLRVVLRGRPGPFAVDWERVVDFVFIVAVTRICG